ncbi:MAG: tetratricopeptide repeat protein [Pyrinomonadaceae bacterium]
MHTIIRAMAAAVLLAAFAAAARSQVDDICAEAGHLPSLDSPFAHVPYVYGRVTLRGFEERTKLPRVIVTYSDTQQPAKRLVLNRTGNYCFRRTGNNGQLVVELDGLEVARRSLPSMGAAQQREDFEIVAAASQGPRPPGVISTKFSRPPNDKTAELYRRTAVAERSGDADSAIELVKKITTVDPEDFIAWAKLGSLYFDKRSYKEADAAYRRALEIRTDYTPAWIEVGKLRMAQKQFDAAIQILSHAVELDRDSAQTFRLLGEAYLQARQGTLGVRALDEALRLDPIGQADAHLLKGRLYELAGAKQLATKEYKAFLEKVPSYAEKKRLEKFIKDNPE